MRAFNIFFAAVILLAGCSQPDQKTEKAKLSGTISGAEGMMINLNAGSLLDSVKLDKSGSFSINLPIEEEESVILILDNRFVNLLMQPGKDLILKSDIRNFPDNLEFNGDLGPANKYLKLSQKLDQKTAISQDELYVMEPDHFIATSDSIRDVKLKLLKEYVARYPEIDSGFIARHKADIQYAWASQRLIYPGYYTLLKKQIPDLPDHYHTDYLAKTDVNNRDLLVSPAYVGFLEDFLDYKQVLYIDEHPEVEKLWFPESVARFRVIQQEIQDSVISDFLLYQSMNDHLDNFGTSHLETFLTHFQFHCNNPDYQELITEKLAQLKTLEQGMPAPNFTAYNTSDEKVELKDFRGSLLYINMWATWSAWSLQEFPYWQDLIRKFEGRELKFISISMDFIKDKKNWKYIIENKDLKGVHLIQDPNSEVWQEEYFINDLPRYLLIDAEGNIISVHAPRPSENMETTLDRLLTE